VKIQAKERKENTHDMWKGLISGMHQELCISTTKPQITQLKQWAKEPGV
jgi:hypothetical protein